MYHIKPSIVGKSVLSSFFNCSSSLFINKADFILEYNECKNKSLKREDVDWSQSKVVFVSPEFTNYQRQAINFRDLPIELYEVSKYETGIVVFNQLKSPETSESINKISQRSDIVSKVGKEIKVYTEADHLSAIPEEIKNFYENLKTRILNVGDDVKIRPRKQYIGFVANTNFFDVHLQKSQIKIWLNINKGELDDPRQISRDVSNIGHWGNGQYEIALNVGDDLDYLMTLVKQSYLKNK